MSLFKNSDNTERVVDNAARVQFFSLWLTFTDNSTYPIISFENLKDYVTEKWL